MGGRRRERSSLESSMASVDGDIRSLRAQLKLLADYL